MTKPKRRPKPDPIKALLKKHPGPFCIEHFPQGEITVFDAQGAVVIGFIYKGINASKTVTMKFARAIAALGNGRKK